MGDLLYRPIRRAMGVSAFGINAYTGENAGDEVIEDHDEQGDGSGHHEELYVVMTGHATFELDGETVDAPAGTLVFVRPEQRRARDGRRRGHDDPRDRRQAGRGGAAVAVRVLVPGRAGVPGAASTSARTRSPPRASSTTRTTRRCSTSSAVTRLAPGGCEDARAHIERAFELSPKAREWAVGDADLADLDL